MSIYNVNNWSSSTTYNINDIVKYNSYFYYSLQNTNLNQTPAINSSYWGGVINFNGQTRPHFYWKPNYNSTIGIDARVKEISFGDGYTQTVPDGINNILLPIELSFDLRGENEAQAILHFLEKRKGSEPFVFTPPPPFGINKLFKCKSFSSTYVFYDNFSIKIQIMETPA